MSEKDWVSGTSLEAPHPQEHKPRLLAGYAQVVIDPASGLF